MLRRLGQHVILQHDLLIVAMLCTTQAALLADQPPVRCLAALEDWCRPRLVGNSLSGGGATLCIAAYGFLISERETIAPSGRRSTKLFKEITIPEAYRPRGGRHCGLNGTFRIRLPPFGGD